MVSQTQDSQEPSAKRVRRSGSNDVQLSTEIGTENSNDMKLFDLCGPASSKTLIMGDGNLSFSLAYARKFDSVKVDATVLEEEDEFYSRYGEDSRDTTKALGQMTPRVRVFFDVDATEVTTYPKEQTSESSVPLPEDEDRSATNTPPPYARIIMNYPHHGGKTNLKHSKALMKDIFSAVSEVLTPDSVFCLTLAKGQPEVSFSKCTHISNASVSGFRHKKDSWQVLYLAAEFGLRCECASPFNPEHFPGYTPAGYLTSKKGFHNQDGTTFFFKKISTPEDDPDVGQYLSDGVNQLLPHFEHHFSVSIVKDDADWSQVERLIRDTSKGTITEISEVEKLRGLDPNTNSENRVYSAIVQSSIPLTRAKCAKYVEETLRPALKEALDKIGFVL